MDEKYKKLKAFDPDSYNSIDLDRLIIYTTVELEKLSIELSLENIIVGAFKLFPKKFSLVGYPEFPDATRVEKALWRCRRKKRQWIGGKTQHGYIINDKTKHIASIIEKELSIPATKNLRKRGKMRRKENILREVLNSSAYRKYVIGKKENISEADVCHLLQGTLDSSRETLKENLISLKIIITELEQNDLLIFIKWIENNLNAFFTQK
jgi:hypothetical protein